MLIGHGGDIRDAARRAGCRPAEVIDLSSNLNPLGPPAGLSEHLAGKMNRILTLPDVDAGECTEAMASYFKVSPGQLLPGNGTTELIYMIPRALNSQKVLIVGPTYADYASSCRMHNIDFDYFFTREENGFTPSIDALISAAVAYDTVFFCNPNNPTGTMVADSEIARLAGACPLTRFVIDESYLPFVSSGHDRSLAQRGLPNVLVLSSLSKIFRIAGLRIGYLIAPEEIIKKFQHFRIPWSMNSLAQEAVLYLCRNRPITDAFLEKSRSFFSQERKLFLNEIEGQEEFKIIPSTTYFNLAKLASPLKAPEFCREILHHRLLIRDCSNFLGLGERYVRFSLKDRETNMLLAKALCPVYHN